MKYRKRKIVCERERVSVCVWKKESVSDIMCVYKCVCVCECVCERERQTDRKILCKYVYIYVCV